MINNENQFNKVMQLYSSLTCSTALHRTDINDDFEVWRELLSVATDEMRERLAALGFNLHDFVYDSNPKVRIQVAHHIDILSYEDQLALVGDTDELVRIAVINKGKFLDRFIEDPSVDVRVALVRKGYALDILSKDSSELVRAAVVNFGYDVESFIGDPSSIVRVAVASKGVGLEILYKDPDPVVRAEVAKQGYAIGQLINDADSIVRASVIEYCVKKI